MNIQRGVNKLTHRTSSSTLNETLNESASLSQPAVCLYPIYDFSDSKTLGVKPLTRVRNNRETTSFDSQ